MATALGDEILKSSIKSVQVSTIKKSTTVISLLSWACVLTFYDVSCMNQAIEGFALMVKRTAQTLQSFGTELAESELPNEIQATTILLSTHTDKKDKMKVKLLCIACTYFLYSTVYCVFLLVCTVLIMHLNAMTSSVFRRIYWWLWVRAAGC